MELLKIFPNELLEEPQSILKGIPEAATEGILGGIHCEIFEATPGAFLDGTLFGKIDVTSKVIHEETLL